MRNVKNRIEAAWVARQEYNDERQVALAILVFSQGKTINKTAYSVRVFGLPKFESSITIAHRFFGVFRVTRRCFQSAGLILAKSRGCSLESSEAVAWSGVPVRRGRELRRRRGRRVDFTCHASADERARRTL